MLAIKWKNKLEKVASVTGLMAAVVGLVYFTNYIWQKIDGQLIETLQGLIRLL